MPRNITAICPKCGDSINFHRNVTEYPDGVTRPGRVVGVVCTRKKGFGAVDETGNVTVVRCGCRLPVSVLKEE